MKINIIHKIISIVVLICFCLSITLNIYAVTESDKTTLQDKINQAKSDLSDISDNKDTAKTELDKLNEQVDKVQNEIEELKGKVSVLNNNIDKKQKEIEDEEKEIKAKNELLKQRMVALYEAGDTSYLDVLFNSDDLMDFISGYSAIQTIVEADTKLIDELEVQKEQLEKDKKSLEDNKKDVEDAKKEQEIKSATLIGLQKDKETQISKLSDEEKTKQAEIEDYNAQMIRVNKELEEAYRKAQEQMKNNNYSNGVAGLKFDGSFIWPCNNRVITSGMKIRGGRWHKGIDIGASYENVYAAASGYAYRAYDGNGYGNYLMIFHGSGYVTLYGHLSSYNISNGQYVSQGQVIATSGNTGHSFGAHLHFEIRQATSVYSFFSQSPLDPVDYLPGGWSATSDAFNWTYSNGVVYKVQK